MTTSKLVSNPISSAHLDELIGSWGRAAASMRTFSASIPGEGPYWAKSVTPEDMKQSLTALTEALYKPAARSWTTVDGSVPKAHPSKPQQEPAPVTDQTNNPDWGIF